MKPSIQAATLGALVALVLSASPAHSTQDNELRAACEAPPGSALADACRHYVAGFLDGALLTDTAIIDSLTRSRAEWSTFMERAYRTRVGTLRAPPPTYLADFCLPPNADVDEVASHVSNALGEHLDPAKSLQQAVYSTIKSLYPCAETG